jgi:hypothetical protein
MQPALRACVETPNSTRLTRQNPPLFLSTPQVLISAGLYQPAPEQPGHSFFTRMQAAKAKAAAAAN